MDKNKTETDLLRNQQAALETRLSEELRRDPSADSFKTAYDELHSFFLKECHQQELYSSELRWFSRMFLDLIGRQKRVLDIGTGNGKLAIALAQNQNQVVGIDISRVALEIAVRKLKETTRESRLNVSFQSGDARALDFADNTFDFAVSHDLIEHISEEDFLVHLREVARVLKAGGRYLFWTPSQLRGGSSLGLHLREYTIKDMIQVLHKTEFTYQWIDLRFYKLRLKMVFSQRTLPLIVWYERMLKTFVKLLPTLAKKVLVPPLFFVLTKSK
jgi:ubiquinone/menaquinone biosynthesis C-methylase UbiE